jgi:hypothetical protein
MRRLSILALSLLIGGILLWVLGAALFCQMTLGKHPKTSSPPPGAETVVVRAPDGAQLSAWWLKSPKPAGNCVAVLHGIADFRSSAVGFAPMFLNEGYSVLVPDSRAHGASGGDFVTYGLLEKYDVIAWAGWMKRAGCRNLYALGESLGASILIESAGVQPVFSAIVAECPYADLREVAEYRVQQMGHMPGFVAKLIVGSTMIYANWVDGFDLRQVSPLASIAHTSTPILLIHGFRDSRTPPYNSERLARANPRAALWLVPNADHTGASSAEPLEFRRRVLEWFAEH